MKGNMQYNIEKVLRDLKKYKQNIKDTLLDLVEDVQMFFLRKIRKIKRLCIKFYYWIPVLMKDEEWDYSYLYIILRTKIICMLNHLKQKDRYVGQDEVMKSMQECIYLLDRLITENYTNEYNEYKRTTPLLEQQLRYYEFVNTLQEQDREKLFSLLSKNIEKWWD